MLAPLWHGRLKVFMKALSLRSSNSRESIGCDTCILMEISVPYVHSHLCAAPGESCYKSHWHRVPVKPWAGLRVPCISHRAHVQLRLYGLDRPRRPEGGGVGGTAAGVLCAEFRDALGEGKLVGLGKATKLGIEGSKHYLLSAFGVAHGVEEIDLQGDGRNDGVECIGRDNPRDTLLHDEGVDRTIGAQLTAGRLKVGVESDVFGRFRLKKWLVIAIVIVKAVRAIMRALPRALLRAFL